jgi:ribose 5-phosphate isomerase B
MRIAIGCDHLGWTLKGHVMEALERHGHVVEDHGSREDEIVDYPDVAETVALHVMRGEAERGVLVCGTGIGMAIAANSVPY